MDHSDSAFLSNTLAFLLQSCYIFLFCLTVTLLPGLGQEPLHQLWVHGLEYPCPDAPPLTHLALVQWSFQWTGQQPPSLHLKKPCRSTPVYLQEESIGLEHDMNSVLLALVSWILYL